MRGITISDLNDQNVLTVDLVDVLRLLGDVLVQTRWKLSGVEALGGSAAEKLQRLSDAQGEVSGQTLLELAAEVDQVVDGEFQGFRGNDLSPWIVIRAVDSSSYDVLTDDHRIVEQIRGRFSTVSEIPA